MTYKKLKVDGKTMRIYLANSIPDEITRLMGLQGIEIEEATAEEFLADYEKRFGGLPVV